MCWQIYCSACHKVGSKMLKNTIYIDLDLHLHTIPQNDYVRHKEATAKVIIHWHAVDLFESIT